MGKDDFFEIELMYLRASLKNGEFELAEAELKFLAGAVSAEFHKYSPEGQKFVLEKFESVSHHIGINTGFRYAEDFYKKEDNLGARNWLYFAKEHSDQLGISIERRVSEIKKGYGDGTPFLF